MNGIDRPGEKGLTEPGRERGLRYLRRLISDNLLLLAVTGVLLLVPCSSMNQDAYAYNSEVVQHPYDPDLTPPEDCVPGDSSIEIDYNINPPSQEEPSWSIQFYVVNISATEICSTDYEDDFFERPADPTSRWDSGPDFDFSLIKENSPATVTGIAIVIFECGSEGNSAETEVDVHSIIDDIFDVIDHCDWEQFEIDYCRETPTE